MQNIELNIGKYNKLQVIKQEKHGFYLDGGEEHGNILLPMKYAPKKLQLHDEIEVFIYLDSEDKLIATTLKPKAAVGEFASLEVTSLEEFGVFLDWGLEKDLLVPFREQAYRMNVGQRYVVYVYVDSSGRIAASTRLKKRFSKEPAKYSSGEEVDLLLYQETELGINCVVNGKHTGLIFKDDIVHHLKLGESRKGFIREVREDGKIDLSLTPVGGIERDELAEQILEKIKKSGGSIDVNAKSSAETINAVFGVSRKKFKIALGNLYKQKKVVTGDDGTRLV